MVTIKTEEKTELQKLRARLIVERQTKADNARKLAANFRSLQGGKKVKLVYRNGSYGRNKLD